MRSTACSTCCWRRDGLVNSGRRVGFWPGIHELQSGLRRVAAALESDDGLQDIEPPEETGVYFVAVGQPVERIKIGFAENVRVRISHLQTANPFDLRLVGIMPGSRSLETQLHERFRGSRCRGEWFYPSRELHEHCLAINTSGQRRRRSTP